MFEIHAGDKLEVRYYCYCPGAKQIGINTVRLRVAIVGAGGPASSDDFASALSALVAPLYKAVLDSSSNYAGLSVQDFPTRIYIPAWSKTSAGAGSVAGNDAPSQASGLISFRTNFAGRKGRGRIFVPFPSVASNSAAGLPTDGYVDDLTVLAQFHEGPIVVNAAGVDVTVYPVIVDDKGVGSYKDILDGIAVQKWATQRRRGSYGRLNDLPTPLA